MKFPMPDMWKATLLVDTWVVPDSQRDTGVLDSFVTASLIVSVVLLVFRSFNISPKVVLGLQYLVVVK